MPDSFDTPAPVNTTTRRACARRAAAAWTAVSPDDLEPRSVT
jgi:hypothetical protein